MEKLTTAWLVYLAAGVLLGLFGWRITRPLSRYWQHFLLVSYAVLVFTPFSLNLAEQPDAYAPALFVAVLNSLFQGVEAGLDAAVTLALIWIGALLVSLIYLLLSGRRVARRKHAHTREATEHPS
ncbi:hypothetical protein KO507_09245 [Gilvimarinus agarilyticus]|uniref:hypothetical protein n=1 Tax=unclassified Gilvimarinus TaxID=2642066 RepID=UPI001C0912E2|nr:MULTISPECIES: hypothetical protein [unclassified Gilvimarinus]MBU2885944.1 hypothetical protein [Gilvimarinus agarilyticus]MDO6570690.1 hypothetical protein [Gilvimarinus sp. 2_MG-2023]MDO6747717.1 hypothetical protein [Gilvimarinus sp. 1_MG-2023]